MISILKYYAILEEHKRLALVKYEHVKSAITLKTEIEKISRRIQILSSALAFETFGSIKISKLEPNSQQFARCDKAVNENIRQGMFKDSGFVSLKLFTAFKIENSALLKNFDKKVKYSENSLLKGLFLPVN